MTVTKKQLQTMIKESVAKHTTAKKTPAAVKPIRITVKELNERVRSIVKEKLEESRAPHNVPSVQEMAKSFGIIEESKKQELVLTEKEQIVLAYASLLAKKGGNIDSPVAIQESVKALQEAKQVIHLTDDELEVVSPTLNEWSKSEDSSIVEAAKVLSERLLAYYY